MITTLFRAALLLSFAQPARATPAAPLDTAYFAGGCFWGVQAVFQHVKGVVAATSGYSGGTKDRPGYEQVSSGATGHAESVRVVYDPAKVSYETLLDVFFTVAHDPTELNRQGPDVGTQYRSAVFFTTPAQHQAVARYIVQAEKSNRYHKPIVTQVTAFRAFYPAEPYHQDYATLHPDDRYIAYNDLPKIAALKEQYPALWSEKIAGH